MAGLRRDAEVTAAGPCRERRRRWLSGLLLALLAPLAAAGEAVLPGMDYDPAIPRLDAVVGHGFGDDITAPADLARYLEALAAAAPERTRLVEYARSWQGRPLHYLLIGSRENMARLDDIRAGIQRLADPRGADDAALERLVEELPAVVWLAHGVHGDEISSPEAALVTAYHLLAARDPAVAAWLDHTLVAIDPTQNPDGRTRFVHHYQASRGLVPQPSPIAAERAQAWPGGRFNHYLFDMNRDWFAMTQPEVRGRVRAFLDYYPLVHVDLHEMGTDSSYYFPPPAVPWNPHLTGPQRAMLETFGRGNAAAFDRAGYRYFTGEVYDAYYPGYGDTWPALQGSAGMTFEMASARGLLGQRSDGSLVSYRDGVRRHVTASLATIATAAGQRARLLGEFLAYRRGPDDGAVFFLPRRRDPGRVDALAGLLRDQGIEVRRLAAPGRYCGEALPAGSYAVAAAQPAGRLATTLLAADSPADAGFWAEQERRAAKRLPVEVYDVVGWSLPQLHDVEVLSCDARVGGLPRLDDIPSRAAPALDPQAVAYLVPWGERASARLLAGALRAGLTVRAAAEPFEHDGGRYPRGSLILPGGEGVADALTGLAETTGATVSAALASWTGAGVDFGSERVSTLRQPHVALAWDAPTEPTSAGAWRYLLERKLDYPVAPVRTRDLDSAWLDQFDVLVLPASEGYADALSGDAVANLQRWVHRGGTLIAVADAVEFLATLETPLLDTAPEWRVGDGAADEETGEAGGSDQATAPAAPDAGEEDPRGPVPGAVLDADTAAAAVAPEEERPPEVPGVLVQAEVDPDHWLGAGLPARLPLMLTGDRIFTPLRLDKGTNVLRFAAAEELAAGGRLWDGAAAQLAFKPAVVAQPTGRGLVIGFVVDPAFRGMMDGLDVLVANAVFLATGTAVPVPPPPPLNRR